MLSPVNAQTALDSGVHYVHMHTTASDPLTVWRAVLDAVSAEVDTVTDELVAMVALLPSYRSQVAAAELRATAEQSLVDLIRAAGGHPADLSRRSEELGRRRARQRVPAEEMTRALRMDFEVLWAAVRRHLGDDDHASVLACLDLLWRAVEDHAHSAERGYLLESSRLARASVASLDTIVGRLFGPEAGRAAAAAALTRALGLPDESQFDVAAAVGAAGWELAEAVAGADARPGAFLAHRDLETTTVFWRSGAPVPAVLARALDDLPCGLASADRMIDVPSGARTARLIAHALPADRRGSVRVEDAWPHLARTALAEAGYVDRVANGLRDRPEDERDRLVTTVRTVLSRGSVAGAAKALHCHRNTVIGRLNRFRDLTGLDVARPRDATLIYILLSDDS